MASPFPGMDPYLERHWRDVHTRLIAYSADALQMQLPGNLVARMEERVYIEMEGAPARVVYPDVRVVEARPGFAAGHPGGPAVAVAEPVLLELGSEPVTERFVQIMDLDGNRIVTAIEVVSPSNKLPGAGHEAYLKKRQEFYASDANIVEVDLVRAGDWVSMLVPYHVPAPYRTTYRVAIRRATRRDKGELYPITLRQRLPIIPIPLRPTDADVTLDLQAILEQVYQNGRYDRTDYHTACDPPLEGEDAAWAEERLREAGRR